MRLALGDARTPDLEVPRRKVTISVGAPGPIAAGDLVVTVRFDEKARRAESLVKLARRWR